MSNPSGNSCLTLHLQDGSRKIFTTINNCNALEERLKIVPTENISLLNQHFEKGFKKGLKKGSKRVQKGPKRG